MNKKERREAVFQTGIKHLRNIKNGTQSPREGRIDACRWKIVCKRGRGMGKDICVISLIIFFVNKLERWAERERCVDRGVD